MKKHLRIIYFSLFFSGIIFSNEIDFSKIKDWTSSDSVSTYDSSNLWEYINGAADLFISYGFQNLQSREMSFGDIECVVDIYNMGNRLNAFGMYKTERGDPKKKLNIGVEAVITSPMQCLLLKDIYYVKVNIYEGELTDDLGKNLLNSISNILPGDSDFPDELHLLPTAGKIPGTENFIRESYLGLSDLRNCVFAYYKGQTETKFQYFILIPGIEKTSEIIWEKLAVKWKSLENKKYSILVTKVPYKGLIGVIQTENGIFGVTDHKTEFELIDRLEKIVPE